MRRRRGLSVLLAGIAATLASPVRAAEPTLPIGGPFELVDHDGRPRRDTDFRGRHLLVYFGYTSCPDLCPLGLDTIAEALRRLGLRAEAVQPVFVTVDPARDTPDALRAYLAAFDSRILGLTGTEAQVAAAARAYRVHRRLVRTAAEGGGSTTLIDHGSLTYLMGPDGTFATLFPHGTSPERMAEVLGSYLP